MPKSGLKNPLPFRSGLKKGGFYLRKPRDKPLWEKWLNDFLLYKEAQGLAERTLKDYTTHVPRFFARYPNCTASQEDLQRACFDYFAQAGKLAPATFNTRRKCLKAFFAWLVQEGRLDFNPVDKIAKRREDNTPRAVPEAVLEKLLSLPDKKSFAGLRDYALLVFTLDTGIRPSEAAGLLPPDFNLPAHEVTIPARVAKTRVSRTLPLMPVTVQAIRKLLATRPESWGDKTPVFCTVDGRPLSRQQWAKRMKEYTQELGYKVRPYDLRHSFAVMYLRHGGHAFGLQRTLGHTTMTMTRRYVELTKQDLKDQHAIASPLNVLLPKKERAKNPRRKPKRKKGGK